MADGGGQRGGGSGSGGGRRRGGGGGAGGSGRGSGGGRPPGGRPPGGGGGARRGGAPGGGRGGAGGGSHQQPLEIAVRSSRNALKRHSETLRDEQDRLACRAMLVALHGNLGVVSNPGELLGVIEQVQHVVHAGRREDAQLPVALRAVVAFALDTPRRQRELQELLRLLLRHLYALAADFMPRQARDDARFRASALLDVLEQLAPEYLDDARFAELQK